MKIVCLQFEPFLGEVQRNIDHATKMIADLKPEDVDVLVLPEMAFTGYVFTSKEHIRPYLEDAETGPSVQWAKTQAVRLGAHVQVGYPEKRIINEEDKFHEEFYNSVCFVSPEGNLLATYSKHFLYYTDENWAEEGAGFRSMPVPGLGQVGFGICMDVNPYQFKASFLDYEFSNFHLKQNTNLLLCSMAWNKGDEAPKAEKVEPKLKSAASKARAKASEGGDYKEAGDVEEQGDQVEDDDDNDEEWEDEEDEEDEEQSELQHETIRYWAVRMNPYYGMGQRSSQEVYLVVANRIGIESGSSCVLKLSASGPELVGALPANKEGLLQVEI
ncbi:Carbon-nitrogen hydrolase [Gamsiella multidivaricata]|nr:Carbon-nitrogen hydrolase [Gamsiella multidivaricata]